MLLGKGRFLFLLFCVKSEMLFGLLNEKRIAKGSGLIQLSCEQVFWTFKQDCEILANIEITKQTNKQAKCRSPPPRLLQMIQ